MIQLGNAVHHDYGYQLAQTFFSEPNEKTDLFFFNKHQLIAQSWKTFASNFIWSFCFILWTAMRILYTQRFQHLRFSVMNEIL